MTNTIIFYIATFLKAFPASRNSVSAEDFWTEELKSDIDGAELLHMEQAECSYTLMIPTNKGNGFHEKREDLVVNMATDAIQIVIWQ